MNVWQFDAILRKSLLGTLSDYNIDRSQFVFQQDLDPKHTSRLATHWFINNNISVLPWAASSPDMSIIEHVWDHVDKAIRCREHRPTTVEQLWKALQEEWAKLDLSYIRALYDSMPRRIQSLQEAKGGYTRY